VTVWTLRIAPSVVSVHACQIQISKDPNYLVLQWQLYFVVIINFVYNHQHQNQEGLFCHFHQTIPPPPPITYSSSFLMKMTTATTMTTTTTLLLLLLLQTAFYFMFNTKIAFLQSTQYATNLVLCCKGMFRNLIWMFGQIICELHVRVYCVSRELWLDFSSITCTAFCCNLNLI
jgi:hypothetical protein